MFFFLSFLDRSGPVDFLVFWRGLIHWIFSLKFFERFGPMAFLAFLDWPGYVDFSVFLGKSIM